MGMDVYVVSTGHIDCFPSAIILNLNIKLNLFSLGERPEAVRIYFGLMHKDIARIVVASDESKSLVIVESLDHSLGPSRSFIILLGHVGKDGESKLKSEAKEKLKVNWVCFVDEKETLYTQGLDTNKPMLREMCALD